MVDPSPTLRQRVLRLLRLSAFTLVVVLIGVPCSLGGAFTLLLTSGGCGGEERPPSQAGLAYEDVSFPAAEASARIPAYFVPGSKRLSDGAAVIIMPTGSQRRGDRLEELAVYHAAGFHTLTFDSRPCVLRTVDTLGNAEAAFAGDALRYLTTRPDVNAQRLGIHGFSAGGAAAIFAAARNPTLQAVVAQGNYDDFAAQIDDNTASMGYFGALFHFGMDAAYWLRTGQRFDALKPAEALLQIAPRAVLLVYGTNEPGLAGARQMAAQGGTNVTLWEVPGAGHGNYAAAAGDEYARRVTEFMSAALRHSS